MSSLGSTTRSPYETQAAVVMDGLSGRLHAELAVERGGMEQVGWWQRSREHDETIHRLPRTANDAKRRGERPVYTLNEENDRA